MSPNEEIMRSGIFRTGIRLYKGNQPSNLACFTPLSRRYIKKMVILERFSLGMTFTTERKKKRNILSDQLLSTFMRDFKHFSGTIWRWGTRWESNSQKISNHSDKLLLFVRRQHHYRYLIIHYARSLRMRKSFLLKEIIFH